MKVYALVLSSIDGHSINSLHQSEGAAQSKAAVFNSWRSAEPSFEGGEHSGPEWDEHAERWNAWFGNAPAGMSCGYDRADVTEMEVEP